MPRRALIVVSEEQVRRNEPRREVPILAVKSALSQCQSSRLMLSLLRYNPPFRALTTAGIHPGTSPRKVMPSIKSGTGTVGATLRRRTERSLAKPLRYT